MNARTIAGLAVAALLTGASVAPAATPYAADAVHSYLGFSVRHLGISNVRGEFRDYSVNLEIGEEDLTSSSVQLEIDAASIDTQHGRRDDHLRSEDFLYVESYPSISFRSSEIRALETAGVYEATGALTLRGVTREVVLPVYVAGPLRDPSGTLRIGVEGEITIDRRDYGMIWNRILDNGGLLVGNEVRISFSLEAQRASGPAPSNP